ncbi:MAG TPA: ATP-binding cassette domain-containing protein [Bacteroidia bacterium]|nr:ATP-binding cassette domain-containing protein [Bacteroidia bacterium]
MSERILRALMQLFAIGASLERLTQQSRSVVESFLRQQISLQRVPEYLTLFDEQLHLLEGVADPTKVKKKLAVSSVKALRICTEINKELNTRQKYIVFIRLAEFIYSSPETITDPEREFLETVANVFTIEPDDHAYCMAITEPVPSSEKLDAHQILLVQHNKNPDLHHCLQLHHHDLEGSLWFLHLRRAGIFVLRYIGKDALTVNGQPVDQQRVSVFTQGAVLRGQKIQPLYYSDVLRPFLETKEESRLIMQAVDLEYTFKSGQKGLHSLNFSAQSGQLVGVMGGSGAGKSTLLSVLNGTAKPSSGKLLINGADVYANPQQLEGVIGNIPQDDLLIEELSVFQNLYYNTKLVYGDLSDPEISQKVLHTLDSLGLMEIKDLKVGNPLNKTISGGQRKRLNIALELVREPGILFVDEPTSGLSSRDAENVMDLLKQLALTGKLVFVVIHQPSSDIFRMFDKLLLLDIGGYPIFFGNPSDSLIYFKRQANLADAEESECPSCGNINPEQLFNIVELKELDEFGNQTRNRKVTPGEWNNLYKEISHQHSEEADIPPMLNQGGKKAGKIQQLKIFFTRDLLSKLSNRQYLMINLLEAPLLATILGFILRYTRPDAEYTFADNPNIPAYLFICVIVSLFLGLSVSAEEIIRDRKILQREKFLNLSKQSYLFSKIALLFILSAIQAISFLIIGNLILGIHGMWVDYFLVLFTISCFANMLGLNISAGLDSVVTIYILIPFLIIPQILLSGVIVRFEKLNPVITTQKEVPLVGDIMASRWAFEALAVNQFRNNAYEKNFYELEAAMSEATIRKDYWISEVSKSIDKTERLLQSGGTKQEIDAAIRLARNEITAYGEAHPKKSFGQIQKMATDAITTETIRDLREYLKSLHEKLIDDFNAVNERKEELISVMTNTPEKEEAFQELKKNYRNVELDEVVRNSRTTERVSIFRDQIIQRYEPVFILQPGKKILRSQFFAPVKNIFGKSCSTYSVNLAVIWMMTLFLYVSLSLDWFRKILSSGKRFRRRKG